MGIQSSKIERNDLKPGDHIFTYRAVGAYSHHGIYIGHDLVVHFTNASLASSGMMLSTSTTPSRTCRNLHCHIQPGSGVVMTCLDCFLKKGDLHRFKYSVNPVMFCGERGGSCTTAKSDEPTRVIDRASFLFRKGFGNYNLFGNNCEDFALYCKTGLLIVGDGEAAGSGRSGQVSSVLGAAAHVAIITSHPVLSQIPGLVAAMMAFGTHCINRLLADIGVRKDVVNISVEDLARKYGWVNDASSSVNYFAMLYIDLGCNGRIRRSV